MAYNIVPTDIKAIHIRTTDSELEKFPIIEGAIFLCTDSGSVYYDTSTERKQVAGSATEEIITQFNIINQDIQNLQNSVNEFDSQINTGSDDSKSIITRLDELEGAMGEKSEFFSVNADGLLCITYNDE